MCPKEQRKALTYPKTLAENLKFREDLILRAESDETVRSLVCELFNKDILFAFNCFFWTYDPRTKDKDVPFITYDFQDEYILAINHAIELGEDIFTDKSRDMGVTYMVLYVIEWRWLTKRSEEFRIGSRKEQYVDKSGDMDSLFEKLRYNLKKLPWFLLPNGFNLQKYSPFMVLKNPENNSAILGEATNSDFARGGRKVAVLFDEFQAWDMDEDAWKSASDATKCKICVGTPHGSGNKFAELRRTSEVKNKFNLMWWRHPKKIGISEKHLDFVRNGGVYDKVGGYLVQVSEDQSKARPGTYVDQHGKLRSQWYDTDSERRSKNDVAENLDCNYLTSGSPYFDILVCDKNLRDMTKDPEIQGNFEWLVSPKIDKNGYCTNKKDLKVKFLPTTFGRFKIWEKPKEGFDDGYVISCDVSEGLDQGDFTSASVMKRIVLSDQSRPEVVAALHEKMPTFELAEELVKLAVWYNRCYIAVERNKEGSGVIMQAFKIYDKIWHKDVITKGYPELQDKMGFETSNRHVKHAVCGELAEAIFKKEFTDPDSGFWGETLTFVNSNGTLEAQGKSQGQKCYDDRIMDRAILWWVHNRMPPPKRQRLKRDYRTWETLKQREPSLVGWTV